MRSKVAFTRSTDDILRVWSCLAMSTRVAVGKLMAVISPSGRSRNRNTIRRILCQAANFYKYRRGLRLYILHFHRVGSLNHSVGQEEL